jgi:outer membrane murein-binding lipoprotein Lpp
MKDIKLTHLSIPWKTLLAGCLTIFSLPFALQAQDTSQAELEERIAQLEQELAEARSELQQAQAQTAEAEDRADQAETKLANAADTGPAKIRIGNFSIGGAIRANYTMGNYPSGAGPTRGGDGGDFSLDTFRVNVDYADESVIGKLEYRWYPGYNFLHTGWVGYQLDEDTQIQVGVNRVPFGPGPYGVSNSWFFDQHYYVGLSDDMDLGVKYSTTIGNWSVDLAYYVSDEGQWRGASQDSARYSYDIVKNSAGNGYEERNQVNARAVYNFDDGSPLTALGGSIQFGQLDAAGNSGSDGDTFAASIHGKATVGKINLVGQLTYYDYDVGADNDWGTGELIVMGAYDFAWPVAAKAWIPAITASYTIVPESLDWLDSVTTYVEYSNIMKDNGNFNDSEMFIVGAAWWRGGWYIYTDLAYSNGNYFVGSDGDDYSTFAGVGDFGINGNDKWNARFNINFGYYF